MHNCAGNKQKPNKQLVMFTMSYFFIILCLLAPTSFFFACIAAIFVHQSSIVTVVQL